MIAASPEMKSLLLVTVLIFTVLEAWAFLSPRSCWYAMEGWKYKNVEPSRASLFFLRWQALPATAFLWYLQHCFVVAHSSP